MVSDAPKKIGRYEILERVGRGGMGVLYKAMDPVLEREVAIKLMLSDFSTDETARPRFYREARAVARLQHRNIVTLFDFGEEDGTPYIVMEFLQGAPLDVSMREPGALSVDRKLDIVAQLCTGLHFSHRQGIIHRDVKPGNVWLLPDGGVKLLDFGIAKYGDATVTRGGDVIGSVSYMAPEQLAGREIDPRADLFAVGVVLYELLCGRRPFQADSPTAIMMKIMSEPPPPLNVQGLPPPLVDVVIRALEKDPAKRFQHAAEIAAELQLIRQSLGSETVDAPIGSTDGTTTHLSDKFRPATATSGGDMAGEAMITPARLEAYAPGATRSARWPLWAGLAVVAALAIGGGVLYLGPPGVPAGAEVKTDPAPQPSGPGGDTPEPGPPVDPSPGGTDPAGPAEMPAVVRFVTTPPGARLVVDGGTTEHTTPVELPRTSVAGRTVRVSQPGFEPLEATVTDAQASAGLVELQLSPVAVPVTVSFTGTYPFAVYDGRRELSSEADSHQLRLTGRRTLRLRAPAVFLDHGVTIDASAGRPVRVEAPGLGRLSVRTALETCNVLIDGQSLGFPPIVERQVAAGSHRLQLTCPDGQTQTTTVTVTAGETHLELIR